MPLTETAIRRMSPPEREKLIGDERGLYLRIYPSGRRTWLFRTRVGGSWKTRNLGDWPTVTLAEARVKASKLAGKLLPEAMTFGVLLDEWYNRRIEPEYRATKNIAVYVRRGKDLAGHQRLSQLTTARLVGLLTEYAEASPVAANRCLANWRLALDYAVECGYIEHNPLARTTSRVVGGKEAPRDRTLLDDEIRTLWADTHAHAPLLRFLLLTGLRISEAQSARQEHIDGDRLHIRKNKSDRPHWVQLTPAAREQFQSDGGYLFEQRSPTAVQARLKRAGVGWTPHDLRRTFATRVAALNVAPHVVEKLLNHSLGGVLAIYNRHDYAEERTEATTRWAAELARLTRESLFDLC
ncbi:MAG TPA: integrase family protein [Denitromonas sp.]|uniref:tyrosine-type recombinase/integrase n=1 Tax=Denitromonas sp. TaxID=2734609 RepID=UPI001E00D245|nr:integrase family protein [Rhodocyclaceae bacterium]MCP5220325.1 integrase family protein [Zoogloeaceae bacterium]HPR05672.1 integrase family protein [Denitromonas sp.]HQU88705.1 integrase family protein [Denitromonas sp.]HQV15545.1 integrase family protein [Denitromonas sp.]